MDVRVLFNHANEKQKAFTVRRRSGVHYPRPWRLERNTAISSAGKNILMFLSLCVGKENLAKWQ